MLAAKYGNADKLPAVKKRGQHLGPMAFAAPEWAKDKYPHLHNRTTRRASNYEQKRSSS